MSDDPDFSSAAAVAGTFAVSFSMLTLMLKKGLVTQDEALAHFNQALASIEATGGPKPAADQMRMIVRALAGILPTGSGSSH